MRSAAVRFQTVILATLTLVLGARSSRAEWLPDGAPVAAEPNMQSQHAVYADGTGGTYLVWTDERSGIGADIYAQRLDAQGNELWTPGGHAVCIASNVQFLPRIATDGAGGIIVVWTDLRNGTDYDIYAQRISPSGSMLWTANGVIVNNYTGSQQEAVVVPDGYNGAWVLWRDFRANPFEANIYLQRMTSTGLRLYDLDGVGTYLLCGDDMNLTAITDGSGGSYFAFVNTCLSYQETFVVRIVGSGFFGPLAKPYVDGAFMENYEPQLASGAAGSVIVAWTSTRYGTPDVWAQRMNASGARLWGDNGLLVCGEASTQNTPVISTDGAGGAIIAWSDYRDGVQSDVFAQRVGISGNPLWSFYGERICGLASSQTPSSIVEDGEGGAVVMWDDYRSGYADTYAQRVDATGLPRWNANGVGVGTRTLNQAQMRGVRTGGAFMMAWLDGRTGDFDLYAQRLEMKHGTWGHPEPGVISVSDNPSDQGGRVVVRWNASARDVPNQATITHYSIWRAADAAVALQTASSGGDGAAGPADVRSHSPAGLVWHDASMAVNEYWELVGTQLAAYTDRYAFNMATRQDSVAGDPAIHQARVIAHTGDAFVFYTSNIGTGYSVDNLAPAPPLQLSAQRISSDGVRLRWRRSHEADLKWYAVYRAGAAGVGTTPVFFLSNATDTVMVDGSAPAGPSYYYVVTALDVHGNQSPASNEAMASGSTGVGDTPSLRALSLLPVYPNPASGAVSLRVGLPAAERIDVEVYDVAGRRVGGLSRAGVAGWQSITYDARDGEGAPLASGVYFYRVRAAGAVETGRFVIRR